MPGVLVDTVLVLLGFGVGVFGTMVGAGGGFILTPVLLLVYPHDRPDTLTTISLAVVLVNAASGSLAYGWQRRIDYRSGLAFAVATLPGAVLGALLVTSVPRHLFDPLMALVLGGMSVWLLSADRDLDAASPGSRGTERRLTDRAGTTYRYTVRTRRGVILSTGVGFLSSFLGIGGGVIHVPLMVKLLGFPMHLATATSHFVLVIMAAAGSATHLAAGMFSGTVTRTLALSVGVALGAQLGAHLSQRTHSQMLQRLLALALLGLALRLAVGALQ